MTREFNITQLFAQAFGYEYPHKDHFVINEETLREYKTSFDITKKSDRKEIGSLGSPFYATDSLGREFYMPVWLDGYLVPFSLISIRLKKTIVSTPLPERGGSVKELVSVDDYEINIKGMAVSEDDELPEDDVKQLFEIFSKPQSLVLRSALTDIFLNGIYDHRVVIKSMNFPVLPGVQNVKPFEIDVESDMIFDLEID